jgi:sirohydrochlorin ferrochelatase
VPATAIVIFAHGSSIESANESVRRIAETVRLEGGFDLVEPAFLEQGRPDLASAVAALVHQGATRIVVLPYFLTLGVHLQRDLPKLVDDLALAHSGLDIRVAPPLEGHPALRQILEERAYEALRIEKSPKLP